MKNMVIKGLLICGMVLLAGCDKQSTSVTFDASAVEASPARMAVPATASESVSLSESASVPADSKQEILFYHAEDPDKELTPEDAKKFATKLLKLMDEDEKYIMDAFQLGEYQTIQKYMMVDLNKFTTRPYSKKEVKHIGDKYFPLSEVMYPYTPCATAMTDWDIYLGVLLLQLRKDTAEARRLVRQEKKDFDESRKKCRHRVSISYEQALKEDKADY